MGPHDVAYILLGVLLIAAFIALFFFTYVAKVEGQIVDNQIKDIVNDLTDGSRLVFNKQQLIAISAVLENNLTMPDMSSEDNDVVAHNKDLEKNAIKMFGIFIGIGVIILAVMWRRYKLDMGEIVKYSLITLALVALTEYLFVTIISKNYVLVDSNYVRYVLMKNLKAYAQS